MSRTSHVLDCGCKSCVNELLVDIDRLTAENKRMKQLIESYGKNPAGFDWAVLGKLDDQADSIEHLTGKLKEIGRLGNKAYQEGTNEHATLHLISVMAREALKEEKP